MNENVEIIKVSLKNNPYNIYVGYNFIDKIPQYLQTLNLGTKAVVVTSKKVRQLYKNIIPKIFQGIKYKTVVLPNGEQAKSKAQLFNLIGQIVKNDKWREKLFIVCLGGGTIGDIGGFAASIYKRGIPYVQIPTTLLAQIDAGIGGKTAIDLDEAKNILGAIYQPKAVFIDPVFLGTLGKKELKEGIAEAVKYGVIKDEQFFYFLQEKYKEILSLDKDCVLKLISVCVKIKADIVAIDEDEAKGIRTILNFGHTLAHALEASLQYKKLSHGEAVSLGMIFAAYLSFILGKCAQEEVEKIRKIIRLFSLENHTDINYRTALKAMSYDKKFIWGKARMVILRKIGKVEVIEDISLKEIEKVLKKFIKI